MKTFDYLDELCIIVYTYSITLSKLNQISPKLLYTHSVSIFVQCYEVLKPRFSRSGSYLRSILSLQDRDRKIGSGSYDPTIISFFKYHLQYYTNLLIIIYSGGPRNLQDGGQKKITLTKAVTLNTSDILYC